MKTHQLKCDPIYFDALERGDKTAEIRYNDRDFQTGDVLEIMSWDRMSGKFEDGKEALFFDVTHILIGEPYLPKNYAMLSIKRR